MSAGFGFSPRKSWVFRQGDRGDGMYVIIHGRCKAILQNKNFLEARRVLREDMLELYAFVDENISAETKLSKTD